MKKAECRDGARLVGRFVDVPRLRSKWAWLFFVSRQARRNKTVASDLNRFRRRFFTAPTSIALRVQAQSVRLSHASALSAGPSNRAAKVGRKPLMECAIWVLTIAWRLGYCPPQPETPASAFWQGDLASCGTLAHVSVGIDFGLATCLAAGCRREG